MGDSEQVKTAKRILEEILMDYCETISFEHGIYVPHPDHFAKVVANYAFEEVLGFGEDSNDR